MVSAGVKQAMEEQVPDKTEKAFNVEEQNQVQQQLFEMQETMSKLKQENMALQVSASQKNRPPIQDMTNQQPHFKMPNLYYGPPQYNPNYQGYWYNQNNNRRPGNNNGRWNNNTNRWNNNNNNRWKNNNNNNRWNNNNNNNRWNNNNGKNNNNNNNLTHYCWTHGLCSHTSAQCHSPMENHQSNATMDNCMGGNTRNICC